MYTGGNGRSKGERERDETKSRKKLSIHRVNRATMLNRCCIEHSSEFLSRTDRATLDHACCRMTFAYQHALVCSTFCFSEQGS